MEKYAVITDLSRSNLHNPIIILVDVDFTFPLHFWGIMNNLFSIWGRSWIEL